MCRDKAIKPEMSGQVPRAISIVLSAVAILASRVASVNAIDLRNVLTDYVLTSWNERDGLPSATITALAQDLDGYLWVGTTVGLFRFDGIRFVPWRDLKSEPIPALPVRCLKVSRDGTLWIGFGGSGGVARVKGTAFRQYGEHDGLPRGEVMTLAEHPPGSIWAATEHGLFHAANDYWQRIVLSGPVRDEPIAGVLTDARGRVVVAAADRIFARRAGQDDFETIAMVNEPPRAIAQDDTGAVWMTDSVVGFRALGHSQPTPAASQRGRGMRLLVDTHGDLWVATGGQGLWRVHQEREAGHVAIERTTSLSGLLGDGVYALLEDSDGNIWAGTTQGLNRLTPRRINQIVDLGIVIGIETTPDGTICAGTVDALVQFSATGRRVCRWREPRGGRLTALYTDERGTLWVASDRALSTIVGGRRSRVPLPVSYAAKQIKSMTSDAHGGLWLYDAGRGLLHWSGGRLERPMLPPDLNGISVIRAYTDERGRAWMAFANGKVGVMDETGKLSVYDARDGLDAGVYSAFHEDADHAMWLGGSNGLSKLADGHFLTVHADHGFPAEGVSVVISDDSGALWLGTRSGIVRIQKREFAQAAADVSYAPRYALYTRSDGIAGVPVPVSFGTASRVAIQSADGRLWFATARGITIINPRVLNEVRVSARVQVERVLLDEQLQRVVPKLVLPPRIRTLEIDYTVPDLTAPLKTRFRYRLEGFDPDWVVVGPRRQAFYTNLSPGSYRFRVMSSQQDGNWSGPEDVLEFSISPTFYRRPWFFTACGLATAALVALFWQRHIRLARRQFAVLVRERARLSREIHDTLLQSLVGVALKLDVLASGVDDPAATGAKREEFVRLRRDVQEYIREARQAIWDLRSPKLQDTGLVTALEETGKRITAETSTVLAFSTRGTPRPCSSQVEEQVLRICQEGILNAIKHASASRIRMEARYEERSLTVRINDDGCGFELEQAVGNGHCGLASMRERAESVGGTLEIVTRPHQGTTITVVVPTVSLH
jgi:signal transduction histidine kinase/streptogramin lyase